jgi:hypothetical protein
VTCVAQGYIFDTSTMPWRHERPALCIWLESSLQPRVLKSIVSHRGRSHFEPEEYPDRIAEKDRATITLYRELYAIEIGGDLSPFDLIIDISSLITSATLEASLESIAIAHSIIRPAAAWYLTGREQFRCEFERATATHPSLIKRNTLLGGISGRTTCSQAST